MRWDSKFPADLILRALVVAVVIVPMPACFAAIRDHPSGDQLDWGVYPAFFGIAGALVGAPAAIFGRWVLSAFAVAASTVAAATYAGPSYGVFVAIGYVLLVGLCVGMSRIEFARIERGGAEPATQRRLMARGLGWTLGLVASAAATFVGIAVGMIGLPGLWQFGLLLAIAGVAGLAACARAFGHRERTPDGNTDGAAPDALSQAIAGGLGCFGAIVGIVAAIAMEWIFGLGNEGLIPVLLGAFLILTMKPSRGVLIALVVVAVIGALTPRYWLPVTGAWFSWFGLPIVLFILTVIGWRHWDRRRRSLAVGLVVGTVTGIFGTLLLVMTMGP